MARILIVEDDFKMAELIVEYLEAKGHTCFWTLDVFHALKTMLAEALEVIVLDLQLPEVSGLSFLKAIRLLNVNIPVLLLTAHAEASTRKEIEQLGRVLLMEKPSRLSDIAEAIRCFAEEPKGESYGSLLDEVIHTSQEEKRQYEELKHMTTNLLVQEGSGDAIRLVSSHELIPGDKLAEDVFINATRLAVSKNTVLTDKQIAKLRALIENEQCPKLLSIYRRSRSEGSKIAD